VPRSATRRAGAQVCGPTARRCTGKRPTPSRRSRSAENHSALDRIEEYIEKCIQAAEEKPLCLNHGYPSAALTPEELERANARWAFVSDEVFGLDADALADLRRAVISSGDRPAMFLYSHNLPVKATDTVFGP
jgi:hypothetical protein